MKLLLFSATVSVAIAGFADDAMFEEKRAKLRTKISVRGRCLEADIDVLPKTDTERNVRGSIIVRYLNNDTLAEDDEFNVRYDLSGLEKDCRGCRIAFFDGKECEAPEEVGERLINPEVQNALPFSKLSFDADEVGKATGVLRNFTNGHAFRQNRNSLAVILNSEGKRTGCGKLKEVTCPQMSEGKTTEIVEKRMKRVEKRLRKRVMTACVGPYPSAAKAEDGDDEEDETRKNPVGIVRFRYNPDTDGSFTVGVCLKRLQRDCKKCSVAIHNGMTCDSHEDVNGRRFKRQGGNGKDPWEKATFDSNSKGNTRGWLNEMSNGFDLSDNVGHALVVYDSDGERVGCGVLKAGFNGKCVKAKGVKDESGDVLTGNEKKKKDEDEDEDGDEDEDEDENEDEKKKKKKKKKDDDDEDDERRTLLRR